MVSAYRSHALDESSGGLQPHSRLCSGRACVRLCHHQDDHTRRAGTAVRKRQQRAQRPIVRYRHPSLLEHFALLRLSMHQRPMRLCTWRFVHAAKVDARRLDRYLLLRASGEEGLIARRSAHHPRGVSGICVGLEDSRNEDRVRRYVRISIRAQEEYRPCSLSLGKQIEEEARELLTRFRRASPVVQGGVSGLVFVGSGCRS